MARKPFQRIDPNNLPQDLRTADLLDKFGYGKAANKLRRDFDRRVKANDPTTGVAPWDLSEAS